MIIAYFQNTHSSLAISETYKMIIVCIPPTAQPPLNKMINKF